MGDNLIVKVNGDCPERLKLALSLFKRKTAIGFHSDKDRLVFFWTGSDKMSPLPAPIGVDRMADLALDWVKGVAAYPREPDHDGDNKKGWIVECHAWGHIEGFGYPAFVQIRPEWIMYGK